MLNNFINLETKGRGVLLIGADYVSCRKVMKHVLKLVFILIKHERITTTIMF